MIRISYDNIIFSLQKAGGISIYWIELIKGISKKKEVICYGSKNENIFSNELDINTLQESIINYKILRYLPFFKTLPAKSIFHSSYFRSSFQKDIVKIVTVYDFTYEYYRKGIARYIHSWQKNFSIRNADGIICISDSTKNDLFKFLPTIEKDKVKTIYISAGEEFHQIKNLRSIFEISRFKNLVDKKIILYVGDRKSLYKNFLFAVETAALLKDYVLVSVGAGKITNSEQKIINEKIQSRFYHFLGISSDELNILYNISFCLLYPSSYEGFGIPIVEAMKAGCPVVSTNISSIPEVAGRAGLLVGEINVDSFIQEILKLENNECRNIVISYGLEQAKKFSWDKCSEETYQFYKKVWEEKFK